MNIKRLLKHVGLGTLPKRNVRALGIDLGTTNSVVAEAVWDPAFPEEARVTCLEIGQATRTGPFTGALVPTVITLFNDERFIGEGAKRLIAQAPELGLKRNVHYFFEAKNEIGTNRTYHRAPEDYRTPTQISRHVIEFLMDAAGEPKPDVVVVTVPASFQVAQRKATVEAASQAGLKLDDGDLLDEPVAAYVDYFAARLDDRSEKDFGSGRLLVFDYGGGTCDIALFDIAEPSGNGLIGASPLSISRFHRLGGGDIDAAIVYGPLLNQLQEQNGLRRGDLSFDDKKNSIEPALRSMAESLKVGLSREIDRRRSLEADGATFADPLERALPNTCTVPLRSGNVLQLRHPALHGSEFEHILAPFFDPDVQYRKTSEYRTEQSIFAPISDALMRGNIDRNEVDMVLLAGGSSNIPACRDELTKYFASARILDFTDAEDRKLAVARGAALQALAKALTGTMGLMAPICQDDIFIKAQQGLLRLIDRGVTLPYPPDGGKKTRDGLAVPRSSEHDPVTLRVEVVAGDEQRLLFRRPWEITPPVSEGEPLILEFSYDANQVLELELAKREAPRAPRFRASLENPSTHVVNPVVKEIEAEELERQIAANEFTGIQKSATVWQLANLLADIGHSERALDFYKALQRTRHYNQASLLNRMAILYGDMSDHESAERLYRESAAADAGTGAPLYNLALLQRNRGDRSEAIKTLEEAIARERTGSYLVFRARLAAENDDEAGRVEFLEEAFRAFSSPRELDDFELSAYIRGAKALEDEARIAKGEKERKRRNLISAPEAEGNLPIMNEGN